MRAEILHATRNILYMKRTETELGSESEKEESAGYGKKLHLFS